MKEGKKNNFATKVVNKKIILGIVAIIVIILGSFLGYTVATSNSVKKWDNKIYSGVNVNDIDLTGKTKEEAIELLSTEFSNKINDKKLIVTVGDKEMEFSYSELSPSYEIEKAINEALDYGKDKSVFAKKELIKNKKGKEHSLELSFLYDEEKVNVIKEKIKSTVNIEPKNASISINGGKISITPDVVGYEVNDSALDEKIREAINGDLGEDTRVSLELETVYSDVKASDLQKINGRMSTFSSDYSGSSEGRSHNIGVATKVVNGTVLMPGEVYSFSKETEKERKNYKNASIYIGNESAEGLGGGICQVSTALYRALMRANIRSVERHNHSMTVYYAPLSLDATMAWGGLDYKFKNSYDFPIYIEGYTNGSVVTFNVYGDVNALGGKTYEMVSETLETIEPTVKYIDDATLTVGTEVIESAGSPGYRSKGYQVTYQNGKEINRELISTDNYMMVQKVVRRGTKPATPTPTAAEVTQPTSPTPPTTDGQ